MQTSSVSVVCWPNKISKTSFDSIDDVWVIPTPQVPFIIVIRISPSSLASTRSETGIPTSRETKINAPTYKCGSRLCGGSTANEKLRFNSKPGGTSKGTKQSAPPPERESTFDYCFHYWPSSVVKCYICLLCFIFFTPLADMTQGVKDPHAQSKHEDIPNGVCGAVQRS